MHHANSVWVFFKDTTKTYTEILEEIRADYRAQATSEDIRGVPGGSTTASALARRTTVEKVKRKRDIDIEKGWVYAPFPDNIGQFVPTEFYSQVKRWYGVLSKPNSSYTSSDKLFVVSFKFNSELRPPMTQRSGGATYDDANTCGGGGNWQQNRDSRNLGGNWRNERHKWNFDQNQANRRENSGNDCPLNRGGHSSGKRSFNASSHRANLRDCSPSRKMSGNDHNYQYFISWTSQHGNTRSRRARMDGGDSPEI